MIHWMLSPAAVSIDTNANIKICSDEKVILKSMNIDGSIVIWHLVYQREILKEHRKKNFDDENDNRMQL